jgi:hypothetical protein
MLIPLQESTILPAYVAFGLLQTPENFFSRSTKVFLPRRFPSRTHGTTCGVYALPSNFWRKFLA